MRDTNDGVSSNVDIAKNLLDRLSDEERNEYLSKSGSVGNDPEEVEQHLIYMDKIGTLDDSIIELKTIITEKDKWN